MRLTHISGKERSYKHEQKKKYLAWYKVTAEYEVPVSFPLLKKIWLGNKQTGIYETEKEQVEYARIKWDGEDG